MSISGILHSRSLPSYIEGFIIPNHLSNEAMDDPKIFDLARKAFADATQAASDLARAQYVDFVEEKMIAGVSCGDVQIKVNPDAKNSKVVLYFHGGAFTLGSWKHLMQIFCPVAFHAGCFRTIAVDYKLASDINPYPSGLNDCIAVYRSLAEEVGAENIFILGDSAGGNLAIRTLQECPDLEPAAIGLFSPLVSAEKVGGTWDHKPKISYEMSLLPHLSYYAPDMELFDKRISPLSGEFKSQAAMRIQTGTLDPLEGQCKLFQEKFIDARIQVEVQEGIWHGVEELDCPEAHDSTRKMGLFFRQFSV